MPEDFAAYRLAKLLAAFSRSHPGLRMDVRSDQSTYLRRDLERGELDLALFKRAAGEKGGHRGVARARALGHQQEPPARHQAGSVPLIGFPTGCLYRSRAIHALESAGRPWHMAYTSSSLSGIQAAVAAGMGLSILSEMAIQADHRVLTAKDGFAPIDRTEVALVAAPEASPATLRLADRLAEFCERCRRRRRRHGRCAHSPVRERWAKALCVVPGTDLSDIAGAHGGHASLCPPNVAAASSEFSITP